MTGQNLAATGLGGSTAAGLVTSKYRYEYLRSNLNRGCVNLLCSYSIKSLDGQNQKC